MDQPELQTVQLDDIRLRVALQGPVDGPVVLPQPSGPLSATGAITGMASDFMMVCKISVLMRAGSPTERRAPAMSFKPLPVIRQTIRSSFSTRSSDVWAT